MEDYETRRKLQNREAQRRYRQKQKQRTSSQADPLTSAATVTSPSASWTSTARTGEYPFNEGDFDALGASSAFLDDDALVNGLDGFDMQHGGTSSTQYFPVDSDATSAYSSLFGASHRTDRSQKTDKHHHHRPSRPSNSVLSGSSTSSSSSSSSSTSSSSSLPKSHAKMNNKVNRMVDDLSQLYSFGVEMQLMHPDDELDRSLGSMRGQFQRSIYRAADSSHGYYG